MRARSWNIPEIGPQKGPCRRMAWLEGRDSSSSSSRSRKSIKENFTYIIEMLHILAYAVNHQDWTRKCPVFGAESGSGFEVGPCIEEIDQLFEFSCLDVRWTKRMQNQYFFSFGFYRPGDGRYRIRQKKTRIARHTYAIFSTPTLNGVDGGLTYKNCLFLYHCNLAVSPTFFFWKKI
jgi:hypothetical protein